jgi:hypothetical protein
MRFAGEAITPKSQDDEDRITPNTRGVRYPQDKSPAGEFGGEVNPTELPMMRQQYMQSPEGGIAQLAPSRIGNFVDHPAVQDTGLPYIMTPEIQKLRRETMNQWQEMPVDMLHHFGIRGV